MRALDHAPQEAHNEIAIDAALYGMVREFIAKHLPDTTVWAYGSRVKGNSRPSSDLDLAGFTRPEQKTSVSLLREAFEESNLPFRVDFLEWDCLPDTFRNEIKKAYCVIAE
jgi:predicted nucleotidyltransferase